MKKYIVVVILTLSCLSLYSQNDVETIIEDLIDKEKYQEVIDKYRSIEGRYSYQVLYNIGLSYYMLGDDENCLKIMNQAIEKDSTEAAPYFILGSTYNYSGRFSEAIPFLEKAISLESDSIKIAQSYRNLGYSLYHLNKADLSIKAYNKALENNKENPLPYIMIAQLYSDMGKDDQALEYYYKGKENSSALFKEYTTILFNIGLFEQLKGNYARAESSYLSLIEIDPTDYHTYAKLIQVYNQTQQYDKIAPLKSLLYNAHNNGDIKDESLSDMFCIDQFMHNENKVRVFERYENGDKDYIYNKLLFYILNKEGEYEYRIQTEYSPAAVSHKTGKYMLCGTKDTTHINYGIIFDDETSYETIKNYVIRILDNEIKASVSVSPSAIIDMADLELDEDS